MRVGGEEEKVPNIMSKQDFKTASLQRRGFLKTDETTTEFDFEV